MKKTLLVSVILGVLGTVNVSAATENDYLGNYVWNGKMLTAGRSLNPKLFHITADDANSNKITVEGLVKWNDMTELHAEYDDETGYLTIPNQYLGYDSRNNGEVWFVNYTVKNGTGQDGKPEYKIYRDPESQFYFSFSSPAILEAGDVDKEKFNSFSYSDEELAKSVCIATLELHKIDGDADDQGFFWGVFGVNAEKLDVFEFVADEWELKGNAKFRDAWLAPHWDIPEYILEYDVPLYVSKTNENLCLLYNPYGPESPFGKAQITVNEEPGYLIFDISDNDCVVFNPTVRSLVFGEKLTNMAGKPYNCLQ